jgi:predicted peptidase
MVQKPYVLNREAKNTYKFNYLISLPKGYESEANDKWPLILYLHGMGERGDNTELLKKNGLVRELEEGREIPFIVVSPQCSEYSFWNFEQESLIALIDEIIENYSVDEDRIYLTGLSMGGFGTWNLAMKYPNKFAAIAPICGGGLDTMTYLIKDLPVWAFHGEKDDVVPVEMTKDMVEALKEYGGNAKLTLYPEAKHDSWTETYKNEELYKWFLEHRRGK